MIISVIAFMAAAAASASDGSSASDAVVPASSAPPAISAPPVVKPKPKKDPLDKVVCHEVGETGSHLGGISVCKTQRQWEAITNASQKLLQDTTRGGAGYKSPGG